MSLSPARIAVHCTRFCAKPTVWTSSPYFASIPFSFITTGMYAWLAFSMMCHRTVTAGPVGFGAAAATGDGDATGDAAGEAAGEAGAATGAAADVAGDAAGAAGFVSAGLGVAAGAVPPQAVSRTARMSSGARIDRFTICTADL